MIRNFLKYNGVQAFLGGIRPCVVGLILATAATLFLGTVLGITTVSSSMAVDFRGIFILGILIVVGIFFKKKPSPIIMILLSAGLGMTLYSF